MEGGAKRKANGDFGEQIRKRLFGKTIPNNPGPEIKSSNKSSPEVVIPSLSTLVLKCEVPDNDDEKLLASDREMLRNAIDKTKSAAKKALSAKDKEIDEIRGEILKYKLEKITYQEKYKKYKHFAETLKKRFDDSKVSELAEAISDLKCKGSLKDGLLRKEREENQKHLNQIGQLQEKIEEMSRNEKKAEEERVKDIIKHSDKVNQLEGKTKVLREKLSKLKEAGQSNESEKVKVSEDSKGSSKVNEKAVEQKLIAKVEPYMPPKKVEPYMQPPKKIPQTGGVDSRPISKVSLAIPNSSNLVTPLKIPKGKLDKKEYFESLLLLNDEQNDENLTFEEASNSVEESETGEDAPMMPRKEQTSKQQTNKISHDDPQLSLPPLGREGALYENPMKNVPEKTPIKLGIERCASPSILEEREKEIVEVLLVEKYLENDPLEEKRKETVEVLFVEKDEDVEEEEIGFSIFEKDGLQPDTDTDTCESDTNEPSSEKADDLKDKIRELSERKKKVELSESQKKVELSENKKNFEAEDSIDETTPRAYDELLNRINDKLIEMAKNRSK